MQEQPIFHTFTSLIIVQSTILSLQLLSAHLKQHYCLNMSIISLAFADLLYAYSKNDYGLGQLNQHFQLT